MSARCLLLPAQSHRPFQTPPLPSNRRLFRTPLIHCRTCKSMMEPYSLLLYGRTRKRVPYRVGNTASTVGTCRGPGAEGVLGPGLLDSESVASPDAALRSGSVGAAVAGEEVLEVAGSGSRPVLLFADTWRAAAWWWWCSPCRLGNQGPDARGEQEASWRLLLQGTACGQRAGVNAGKAPAGGRRGAGRTCGVAQAAPVPAWAPVQHPLRNLTTDMGSTNLRAQWARVRPRV